MKIRDFKRSQCLKKYYEQVKSRAGQAKLKIAAARKFLGIIYNTLKTTGCLQILIVLYWQSEKLCLWGRNLSREE